MKTLTTLALLSLFALPSLRAQSAGTEMIKAAEAFLASLSPEQQKKATMKYSDPLRGNWDYWPMKERKGLSFRSMNEEQQKRAKALLKSALSEEGLRKAEQNMLSEAVINFYEKNPERRDPLKYYWTLFGKPGASNPWGLSVEGHHMSLNFAVENGRLVCATPLFYGTNPDIIPPNTGDFLPAGTRILAEEQDLAFQLLGTLSAEQKQAAIIAAKAPRDMDEKNQAAAKLTKPVGISGSQLNPEQQALLTRLVKVYLYNLPDEYAGPNWMKVVKAGAAGMHFAWQGGTEKTVGHSYAIFAGDFVIQYYNTQGGADGVKPGHAHAVLRTTNNDFNL